MGEARKFIAGFDAASVERELSELWAEAIKDDQEKPGVRRRAINVIAVVADNRGAQAVSRAASVLAGQYPGRYIIIILNPDKDSLANWAAEDVRCELCVDNSPRAGCEQIIIPYVPGRTQELPDGVRSLLQRELPVVLWWRYIFNPREYLFEEFSRLAARIIVDSVTLKNPRGGFARIYELNETSKHKNIVRDINWTRLNPWRLAIAGFYDVPGYRPYLAKLNKVEIEYSHQLSRHNLVNNSQVLMLFGWLASRLGWRPLSGFSEEQPEILHRIDMAAAERITCRFRVFPAPSHREAGIKAVRLTAEGGEGGSFTITRCDDHCHMRTTISLAGKKPAEKITCLEIGSEVEQVAAEMNITAADPVYNETMAYLRGTDIIWPTQHHAEI